VVIKFKPLNSTALARVPRMETARSSSMYLKSFSTIYQTGKHSIYEVTKYKVLKDSTSPNDKRRVHANTNAGTRDAKRTGKGTNFDSKLGYNE
jgi:hypothetical protein